MTIEVNGIPCDVDKSAFRKLDVLDLYDDVMSGKVQKVPKLAKAIYGEEQYEAIRFSLSMDGKDGDDAVEMSKFIQATIDALAEPDKADPKN